MEKRASPRPRSGEAKNAEADSVNSADTQAPTAGTDGDAGDGEGGDDDDGEPPTVIPTGSDMAWWQISLLVASILTITAFVSCVLIWNLNRFHLPLLLSTFITSFAVMMYFNPRRWYQRVSRGCLAALAGGHFFGGLFLEIPLPHSSTSFVLMIPEPHWSVQVTWGMLAAAFAVMHWAVDKSAPK